MHLILRAVRCALAPVLCFACVVLSPSPTPSGLALIAKAQASDALARKCRKAVFDKYGQRKVKSGRPVRSLKSKFVQSAVDSCVANGGTVM